MQKESILIFGASSYGYKAYKDLKDEYIIKAFIDNDVKKSMTKFNDKIVILPNKLQEFQYDKIVIASSFSSEIFYQLVNEFKIPIEKISQYESYGFETTAMQKIVLFSVLSGLFLLLWVIG